MYAVKTAGQEQIVAVGHAFRSERGASPPDHGDGSISRVCDISLASGWVGRDPSRVQADPDRLGDGVGFPAEYRRGAWSGAGIRYRRRKNRVGRRVYRDRTGTLHWYPRDYSAVRGVDDRDLTTAACHVEGVGHSVDRNGRWRLFDSDGRAHFVRGSIDKGAPQYRER